MASTKLALRIMKTEARAEVARERHCAHDATLMSGFSFSKITFSRCLVHSTAAAVFIFIFLYARLGKSEHCLLKSMGLDKCRRLVCHPFAWMDDS